VKNPFGVDQRVTLMSPLSPEACMDRLRAETGSMWNPLAAWTSPVRGSVNEHGFRIVKAIHYRNSMQSEATGKWVVAGGGTQIDVEFAMNRLGAVAMMIWLGFVGAFAILWTFVPHASSSRSGPAAALWVVDWIPYWMFLFGIALVYFGRWLARGDNAFLADFLHRTLDCAPGAAPME
jgi:hypothetical protein